MLAGLLVATLLNSGLIQAQAEEHPWVRVADDLEIQQFNVDPFSLFSVQFLLVRTELERYRISVVRAADYGMRNGDPRELCRAVHGSLCINANFFDEQGKPLGLVVNRGIQHQAVHRGGSTLTGVFQVSRGSVEIVHRDTYRPGSATEAVQAGPRLIAGGKPVLSNDMSRSRRAGVCLDAHKRVIFFHVSAAFSGVSISELQKFLLNAGCVQALNFDGGGSAQIYISGELPGVARNHSEIFLPGRDPVPVMVALLPK